MNEPMPPVKPELSNGQGLPSTMPEENPFALPEVKEDSFGKPITAADMSGGSDLAPEPVFENGVLGAPINTPPVPESGQFPPLAEKKIEKKSGFGSGNGGGLPLPVVIIIYVVIACLIGVAVYFLWRYQYNQIQVLQQTVTEKDIQLRAARQALIDTNDQTQMSSAVPVYVAPDGGFSFFQDVPGMMVNADNGGVRVTLGQVNGETPTDGFLVTISEEATLGLGLSRIVDDAYVTEVVGQANSGKREEILADNVGFSYVENDGRRDKVIYFLQRNMSESSYMRIEYVIAANGQVAYDNYEKTVLDLIGSLKIYQK